MQEKEQLSQCLLIIFKGIFARFMIVQETEISTNVIEIQKENWG